jgi:hypothetical protein
MTTNRVMPICKFCKTECEAGRNPRENGWRCNNCGHWQSEYFCNACGSWTNDAGYVQRWRDRQAAAAAPGGTGEGTAPRPQGADDDAD